MKMLKVMGTSIVIVLGVVAVSAPASAHGGVRFGLYVGAPVFWPGYYPAPYYAAPYYAAPYYPSPYYYPPVVTAPASPPVYIEQNQNNAQPAPQSEAYWYYCAAAKAYYPYVKQCAGGWQRVAPQPPPS